MPCLDLENNFSPGDSENVILRKILNRLCNVTSGGGGGVSQAYVDARDAATLASANANAVAGDVATLAAAMSSASALYVLKSGDTMTGALLLPAGAVGAPALSRSGNTNTGLWFPAADTIAFSTAGAERFRILSTGEVGIGTVTPGTKLDVISNITNVPSAQIVNSNATGYGLYLQAAQTSRYALSINNFDASVNLVTVLGSGNVGIGITAPLARLHVTPSASGTDYFRIDHSDGTPRFQFGVLTGGTTYSAVYFGNIVPDAANYSILANGVDTYIAAPSGELGLVTAGTSRWRIPTTGHFLAQIDNTYDIGASGATRPRNVYVAGNVFAGGGILSQAYLYNFSSGFLLGQSDGVWTLSDIPGTGVNRLQFGGTTASFPSIKRSSATLQARLADDSAFADVSVASIRTNNAAALVISSVAMNDGAAAALGTLTNAPAAGNPTKWIPIDDNGTTRYIPAW